MLEFLEKIQLEIMPLLSGACLLLVILTLQTKILSPRRRRILALMQLAAGFLLIAERAADLAQGNPGETAFWVVRIGNFLVYAMMLFLLFFMNHYLCDLYQNEGGMQVLPKRLRVNDVLFLVGMILLIISQFTNLYYTFDVNNVYTRAAYQPISYIFPLIIIFFQMSVVIQYYHLLSRRITRSLILFTVLPLVSTIIQFFLYGLYLTDMTVVGMVVVLYLFALNDLSEAAARANELEIKHYQDEQRHIHTLFEQTAEALVNAIDAKDEYTHGHSTRVAEYSREIARAAGKSPEECNNIYFSALLHDVGKIGVPDEIINKNGKLTNEEFDYIKDHPGIGSHILSGIHESPYLSIGARYHHERFDGCGYPDGLKGSDIPEIARIICVADAYDAMTSKRSYRETLPREKVREELTRGMGTQFDPEFAKIMLRMMDKDTDA